ncbi:Phosphatidylglycerophosphatase A [Helicobacter heilmannii]|uniref:Phosphatidylglycerophosphatase A n=2 Tax=Helicobacter heilmannii TaxID=35817 RepID=A0A0K2Y9Y6_HELHE|nr:phosphatidylglycerophosphatase A [Helicobacter heilmannii]CCM11577.1 Phosphatidylglycerophosphatase A [Helicobacter heilmannii ASB1.4]CRF49918.1 Phosphatidylglycerophosphatase A [Helicobacter heilmannii]CRI34997.1 Phosphatidylglycerophosphatase A [Helicobacter heilmannii]BDQ26596.1 phosphatidylglycerophosphatase A [Helicobacter heilmannii]GMB95345.1 Phosphatidylglycerophosphatase A PgpA [Helicobacter heilmannii]
MRLLSRECFLTLFYAGKFPKGPGTVGSVVALFLGLPLLYLSANTLFLCAVLIGLIAIKQIDIYEEQTQSHDDKQIVIDELVGMWMAMAIAGLSWLGVIASFVFFRLFDIYKPSLIGKIDRDVKGGLGVVGDDALAGICGGFCALLVTHLW